MEDFTKGKWHIGTGWNVKKYIYDEDGVLIAQTEDLVRSGNVAQANAERIVKAVNSYDAMKRALKQSFNLLEQMTTEQFSRGVDKPTRERIKQALALAEGKQQEDMG